jgi:Fic family protein
MNNTPLIFTDCYLHFSPELFARGSVKSGELVRLYGFSRQAAGKELKQMVGLGLVRAEEKGRATRYVTA